MDLAAIWGSGGRGKDPREGLKENFSNILKSKNYLDMMTTDDYIRPKEKHVP